MPPGRVSQRPGPRATQRAGLGPLHRVQDDRERQGRGQEDELRAGEEREADRAQGKQVGARRGADDRPLHREHGPEECRQRDDLGQDERREREPRQADRQHRDQVADPRRPLTRRARRYAGMQAEVIRNAFSTRICGKSPAT